MTNNASTQPWFAMQVRSGKEGYVASCLRSYGYEEFLPVNKIKRQWSDRVKEQEQPLFPGYLFCRFDPAKRLPVLRVPYVQGIVGGKQQCPVSEEEIESLRRLVESYLYASPTEFPRVGDIVEVIAGPLRGVRGTLLRERSGCRLAVSVSILQRSVSVQVDADCVMGVALAS